MLIQWSSRRTSSPTKVADTKIDSPKGNRNIIGCHLHTSDQPMLPAILHYRAGITVSGVYYIIGWYKGLDLSVVGSDVRLIWKSEIDVLEVLESLAHETVG